MGKNWPPLPWVSTPWTAALRNAQDEMDGLVVINMGWKKVAQFEDYAQAHAALAELAKKVLLSA